jgi:hypothetical protein
VRSNAHPAEVHPIGSVKYDLTMVQLLMGAIVPRDMGSYSYAETGFANPHSVTSVGGTTYTYDDNGNVSAVGSLDYTWDWRNRLASAERSGGGTTSYGYDHLPCQRQLKNSLNIYRAAPPTDPVDSFQLQDCAFGRPS